MKIENFDGMPVELTGEGNEGVSPFLNFQLKGVPPLLAANIQRIGYLHPTPVQRYAIPSILAGRDLVASAQTGSGKTAGFLFPIITKMLAEGPPSNRAAAFCA